MQETFQPKESTMPSDRVTSRKKARQIQTWSIAKREEFCITLMKLKRTCQSEKAAFLIEKFPSVCQNIQTVMLKTKEALNISLCDDMRWDRVR